MKKFILITLLLGLFITTNSYSQHKEYEGNGDDIITLDKPDDGLPALLVVNGNLSERHFSITGFVMIETRMEIRQIPTLSILISRNYLKS